MREHEFWVFENVTEEMQKMNGFEQKQPMDSNPSETDRITESNLKT